MSLALVEAAQRATVTDAAQTTIGTTAGQIFADRPSRRGLCIQNTGATVIKVNLGLSTPTQTVYHIALKACASANDGSGGVYLDDAWTGPVQAISDAAGGTFVAFEVTA